jgi:hypothetical protein
MSGSPFKNIKALLAAAHGEINGADLKREYLAHFGTELQIGPGEKLREYLERAAAKGACRLEMRPMPKGPVCLMIHKAATSGGGPHAKVDAGNRALALVAKPPPNVDAFASIMKGASFFSSTTTTTTVTHSSGGKSCGGALAKIAAKVPDRLTAEVALCFDTTGSMYSYLEETRKQMSAVIEALVAAAKKSGAQLRVGVIAHGDYCDKASSYVLKFLPLLDAADPASVARLLAFVREVGPTGGGDTPECYELALRKASREMGWGPHSARSLVMVGDAPPHPVGYTCGDYTNNIDWTTELADLATKQVKVYAVQCGTRDAGRGAGAGDETSRFWQRLADDTGGRRVAIANLSSVKDLILAAVCRDLGDGAFADLGAELRKRGAMSGETAYVYETVRTVTTTTTTVVAASGKGGSRGFGALGGKCGKVGVAAAKPASAAAAAPS